MANEYTVTLSNGDTYTVTTGHHHGDHTVEAFKKILGDIVKQSTGSVIAGTILHFALKKR